MDRYGTRDLVPLNSIEFVGYIVITDMMFYDVIGNLFLDFGWKNHWILPARAPALLFLSFVCLIVFDFVCSLFWGFVIWKWF